MVIWVFIFIMKPFFENNNKDYLYIESCINKVYGDMNNFMYASSTSKGLMSGTISIFPEQYIIKFKNSNQFWLEYKKSDGTTGSYLVDSLTWLKEYYCRSNTYTSKFSWELFSLTIDKSSSATNGNSQWYVLSGTSAPFTGGVSMYLCYGTTGCREVAKFEVDTRIQMIKKRKCLTINNAVGQCNNRDQ